MGFGEKMETKIAISKNLIPEVEVFVDRFGFKNETEFVNDAIKEKILALKRDAFIKVTGRIAKGLESKGVFEKEILADFEMHRG